MYPGQSAEAKYCGRRRAELAVQQQRDALGRVGVLVQVDADAGDAVDGERPRRRVVQEGQHPAAHAGVDVAAHAPGRGGRGDLRHGVHHAVRVGRRRGHDQDGGVVDRGRHRVGVGAVGDRVDVDQHRAGRRSSAPPCGTPRGPWSAAPSTARRRRAVTRARPARSSSSDSVPPEVAEPTKPVGCVQQPAGPAHQVVLHAQQRGERRGVQPVGGGEHRQRLEAHRVGLGQARVVDVGQGAAAVGGQVVGPHRLERAQDPLARPARLPVPPRSCRHLSCSSNLCLVQPVPRDEDQRQRDQHRRHHREAPARSP